MPVEPVPPPEGPRWEAARGGDPLDLARLGNREPAITLLSVAERYDEWAHTALRAIPYSEDAEVALRPLCDALLRARRRERLWLETVHAVAAQPPRDTEVLDPGSAQYCRDRLAAELEAGRWEAQDRDLAASALQMLDEHTRCSGAPPCGARGPLLKEPRQ